MAYQITTEYQNENRHLVAGGDFFIYSKVLPLEKDKNNPFEKVGIGNRRLLEKIKSFFSKIVIIVKFVKKTVYIQESTVAHTFDIPECQTFRRIFDNLIVS